MFYHSDHVESEDMDNILEMSLVEYKNAKTPIAGPSNAPAKPSFNMRRHDLNSRMSALEAEIQGIDGQIQKLNGLRQALVKEKQTLMQEAHVLSGAATSTVTNNVNGKGKSRSSDAINYTIEFDWSSQLKGTMRKVFGINNFRLCQQGVCNANMDGRDVVCVMPTGGGKSLTYQLPALLTPGCTLVISPLISLITDQILHLNEAGVEAVMLTGGTSKAQAGDIQHRLTAMVSSQRGGEQIREIKLCYVTPEKISKSKTLMSLLHKLVEGGMLGAYFTLMDYIFKSSRIVIDEAHCVSQLGHDFRPDYKKLSVLRQFFPHIPILALSATCPPKVLQDILKILRMKAVVDGKAAPRDGTVYFSAPLYRKNLHYSVLPKPSSSKHAIMTMVEYIFNNHKNDSGIVYCLTKKDAESVAESIQKWSSNRIKTGVYHADIADAHKEQLHRQWRDGNVQVVCATIAFGLGIDKGNVRFVLHHTLSKSLDGYYQESGRAGRDGQDADCVLYYRPQDATRQSSITCKDMDGLTKLHDILRFAQDMQECRKILFAKYFSTSSDLSMAAWTTEESNATDRCGHCDNCTRPPETVEHSDATLEAWKILKILENVDAKGGRQTIAGLGDLARGLGGGTFEANGKRRKTKEKLQLDYDTIAGGKVGLSKDDVEKLIVQLLILRYLSEAFSSTAYSVNVYVTPGELAIRLTRYTHSEIMNGNGPRIHCSFSRTLRKGKATAKGSVKQLARERVSEGGSDDDCIPGPWNSRVSGIPVRMKNKRPYDEVDEELQETGDEEDFSEKIRKIDELSDEEEDRGWEHSIRPTRKQTVSNGNGDSSVEHEDSSVIYLSSD